MMDRQMFLQQLMAAMNRGGQGVNRNPMYQNPGQFPQQAFGGMGGMPQQGMSQANPQAGMMPALPQQSNAIAGMAMGGNYSPQNITPGNMGSPTAGNYGMSANPMAMNNANSMARFRR